MKKTTKRSLTRKEQIQITTLLKRKADEAATRPYSKHNSSVVDCCSFLIEAIEREAQHG